MAMNPAMLFKIKSAWDKFVNNHPKFPMFLRAASATGIKEGYIIEVKITDTEGKRVRAIRYKADFTYYQPPNRQLYGSHAPYYAEQSGVPWEFVVEDVKSKATRTAKYAMKKKMLKDRFGYDITEV